MHQNSSRFFRLEDELIERRIEVRLGEDHDRRVTVVRKLLGQDEGDAQRVIPRESLVEQLLYAPLKGRPDSRVRREHETDVDLDLVPILVLPPHQKGLHLNLSH